MLTQTNSLNAFRGSPLTSPWAFPTIFIDLGCAAIVWFEALGQPKTEEDLLQPFARASWRPH
jgi:hypothetical protein